LLEANKHSAIKHKKNDIQQISTSLSVSLNSKSEKTLLRASHSISYRPIVFLDNNLMVARTFLPTLLLS